MTVRATWGLTRQALTKSSPLWRDFRWPERQSPLAVSSTPSATGPAPTTRPAEARLPLAHQDHDQASAAELRPVLAEGNVHQQWQPDPDVVRMRSVRCGTVQGQGVFWRLPPAPGLVGISRGLFVYAGRCWCSFYLLPIALSTDFLSGRGYRSRVVICIIWSLPPSRPIT